MSKKKSKNQYKHFPVISLEDGLATLGSLISHVAINLEKYKEYSNEISILIDKYKPNGSETKEVLIPAKEYDDINDKLLYRQRELLKFVADHQKSSFSYINLREILKKNKFISSKLDDKLKNTLDDFLDIRNWSFHNPKSLLAANKEVAEKSLPNIFKDIAKIQYQLNPLIITHISEYDYLMLTTLKMHTSVRLKQFDSVFEQMKNDYKEMYKQLSPKPMLITETAVTSEVIFYERNKTRRFFDPTTDVAQISMAIQKSKYDGSESSYNNWAVNKIQCDNNQSTD